MNNNEPLTAPLRYGGGRAPLPAGSYETLVQGSIFGILLNFSAKNPP